MVKSEDFLLTFFQCTPKISPPLVGGDEGEGDKEFVSTPTLTLPHRKGGGEWVGKFQICLARVSFSSILCGKLPLDRSFDKYGLRSSRAGLESN